MGGSGDEDRSQRSEPHGGSGPRGPGEGGADDPERRRGGLEALFQELVRRGTALGLSSFFLTEEAVRRAVSDTLPADWVDFVGRRGEEMRRDLVEALAREFGAWLRDQDAAELLRRCLEEYDLSAHVELKLEPRGRGDGLRIVPRRG